MPIVEYNGYNIGILMSERKVIAHEGPDKLPNTDDPTSPWYNQTTASIVLSPQELDGYSAVVVTASVNYPASVASNVVVYALYSPDGVNYDSVPDTTFSLNLSPGSSVVQTTLVPIFTPYLKVGVENPNTGSQVGLEYWVTLLR